MFSEQEVDFTCILPAKNPLLGKNILPEHARVPLADIDRNVKNSQRAAYAEGTLRNLTTQWVKYLSFMLFYGLDPLPVKVLDLCRYAQFLSSCLKAHASLVNYLAGVKTLHILLDMDISSFDQTGYRIVPIENYTVTGILAVVCFPGNEVWAGLLERSVRPCTGIGHKD